MKLGPKTGERLHDAAPVLRHTKCSWLVAGPWAETKTMILVWLIVIGALFGLWLAFRGVSRKVDRLQRMVDDLVARPLPEAHPDGQMVRAPAAEGAASAATPPVVSPMPMSPLHRIPSPLQRPVRRAEVRFPPAGIERPPAPLVPAPALRPSAAGPAPAVLAPAPASVEREIIAEQPPALPGQEWEAVIGGSWLNKVGVLVFVIGIALFIGYSLTELGPAGRIAIGIATALAMLLAGVVLERRDIDTMYGRGLIGGGWAALYFTTYAAHGVEAARVIDSPVLATALLLAVAAGMIAHSIRYRSQVVTGLAYFVGFATLAITEMTGFALIASVPLAASLLIVARTFAWDEMAILGVAVTYGAYLFSVAGRQPSWSGFLAGESVITIYWLMFECFALLEVHGRGPDRRKDVLWSALFAMNSCAFIGVSMLQWTSALPLYVFLAAGGALFSIDSAVRGAIAPAHISRYGITLERLFEPGYEASITVGAILATAAIFEKFSGLAINIALLLEGEMLLIAAIALGLGYLRMLAGAVLGVGAAKLLLFDRFAPRAASLAAFPLNDHTAVAVVTAAAMYLDRIFSPDKWRGVFGYAAGLVLAALIGFEAPVDYVGLGWLLMGVFLFDAGLLTRADDFRMQGYAALAIGSLTILGVSIFPVEGASALGQKIALSAASILAYAIAAQAGRAMGIADEERATVRDLALGVGAAFLATLLWYLLQGRCSRWDGACSRSCRSKSGCCSVSRCCSAPVTRRRCSRTGGPTSRISPPRAKPPASRIACLASSR